MRKRKRRSSKNFFENPEPIAAQNFFYVSVTESALDQSAGDTARMGMVSQIGNEMRRREFCRELLLPRLGPLTVNEFKEIKADSNAVDADQISDVLDVIDVAIERAFFFSRAHEDGIDADHPAPFTDDLDLFITN